MTRNDLLKGLQILIKAYGEDREVSEITQDVTNSARQLLADSHYSISDSRIIVGTYFGFCFGREYGFKQGISYVFNHEPTPEELGE